MATANLHTSPPVSHDAVRQTYPTKVTVAELSDDERADMLAGFMAALEHAESGAA